MLRRHANPQAPSARFSEHASEEARSRCSPDCDLSLDFEAKFVGQSACRQGPFSLVYLQVPHLAITKKEKEGRRRKKKEEEGRRGKKREEEGSKVRRGGGRRRRRSRSRSQEEGEEVEEEKPEDKTET